MPTPDLPDPHRLLDQAHQDHASVIDLTTQLVRTPSRGGIDPYDPVLGVMAAWLADHGLKAERLHNGTGDDVGLVCELAGRQPGPTWVLNACLDTAPFGDADAWQHPPTSGTVSDGWLHGRGAADSAAGAAVFAHIAQRVAERGDDFAGRLVLLFDVDEHTGNFGGAQAYFNADRAAEVAGVIIGYPGIEDLVVGSRGVYRAVLAVHGIAGHSGAGTDRAANAITKAAHHVQALAAVELPAATAGFPPPKLTITAIAGGEGYSVVPDLCHLHVDVRTTPTFDTTDAQALLRTVLAAVDLAWPQTAPTTQASVLSWPAYALADDEPVRRAVLQAAQRLGLDVAPKISGPSNIGNYLATMAIPATAGWGVRYEALHGTDERIDLATIPLVHATYHAAVLDLLTSQP